MNHFRLFVFVMILCLLLSSNVLADNSVQTEPEQIISASMDDSTGIYTEFSLSDSETGTAETFDPFVPDGIETEEIPPYTIFGSDDRTVIKYSPTNFPYTAVVKLYTEWNGRNGKTWYNSCSGFMIGPNYAVTAAHCIFSTNSGYARNEYYEGWAKSVKVCPAAADRNEPYGCAYATKKIIMDVDVHEQFDVAVLQLERPIGNQSGWMGSYILKDSECNKYAQLLGYASDQDMKYMFYSAGYLEGTTMNGKQLKYKLDTLSGSSGGPVIINYNDRWGYLVGINVSNNNAYNFALRLTDQVYDFLSPYWGK